MANKYEKLASQAKNFGAAASGVIDPKDISFDPGFRLACEQNYCGKYDTNWMCPPGVGELESLKAKIKGYEKGVVFQTVYQMDDSFDIEGMGKAREIHQDVFEKILEYIRSNEEYGEVFPLNVGACSVCKECSYVSKQPCRFPEKAVASVEACGIDVNAMLGLCGIPYNNGTATVSYVGLFLF
ncbi:MAG: DUF2284 domain-containing protein [Sedimentisphaeraceae bacterium JB056]